MAPSKLNGSMHNEHGLEERTLERLRGFGVKSSDTLVLGVSGGADSVALAHVLTELRNRKEIAKLVFLHVNHGLRAEESIRDEMFVRKLSEALAVELHVEASEGETIEKTSEDMARIARYKAFVRVATEFKYNYIVTAHTANDQAETLLMRLLRGAGIRGLAGIPATRMINNSLVVLRPWLDIQREEIKAYLNERSLPNIEDSTNAQKNFTRNRIRHELMPLLSEIMPGRDIVTTLARTSKVLRNQSSALDEQASSLFAELELPVERGLLRREAVELSDKLLSLSDAAQFGVLECGFRKLNRDFPMTADLFTRAQKFLREKSTIVSGARFDCGRKLWLSYRDQKIILENEIEAHPIDQLLYRTGDPLIEGEVGVTTDAGVVRAKLKFSTKPDKDQDRPVVAFNLDALLALEHNSEIWVRNWREGDRLLPQGMSGTKLISDVLLEAGIRGKSNKKRYPLVYVKSTGLILWVPGIRRSNVAPVSDETIRILELTLEKDQGLLEKP